MPSDDLAKALKKATALSRQQKTHEAVRLARQIAKRHPDSAEVFNTLGALLAVANLPRESLAAFDRALVLKPSYADAYSNMGNILAELGKFEAAKSAYERAVELAPQRGTFHRNLAFVKDFRAGDPQLAAMAELALVATTLPPSEQTALQFALSKAYADLGEHERSFQHLLQANAQKRHQTAYDEAATLAAFARIHTTFPSELIAAKRDLGHPSPLPIFIVGMPRSGTTLTEQILASHPKVFGAGELDHFYQEVVTRIWDPKEAGAPSLSRVTGPHLWQGAARYLARISRAAPAADRVVDKMPSNFRFLGLIHLALPNARIIHIRRDPLDTCLSCFSVHFAGDHPYAYDLGELGRYYRAYERLMEHWRRVLPPHVLLEIRYEDLVADLDREARRIVAHCGLEWNDSCLDFHKTQRSIRTASARQVRQPLYHSSIGRWRQYAQHLAPF